MSLFFNYCMILLVGEMVIHLQKITLEISLRFIMRIVFLKNQCNLLFFICQIFIVLTLLYRIMHQMPLLASNSQAILKY